MRAVSKRNAGFSLIELSVVTAVVASVGSMAVMAYHTAHRAQALRGSSRSLLADLRQARTIGITGQEVPSVQETPQDPNADLESPPEAPEDPDTIFIPPDADFIPAPERPADRSGAPRLHFGGIVIRSASSYDLYGDVDRVFGNGNETVLQSVNLATRYPEASLRIVSPAPGEHIRFFRSGIRDLSTPGEIVIQDVATGRQQVLQVAAGGNARIQ